MPEVTDPALLKLLNADAPHASGGPVYGAPRFMDPSKPASDAEQLRHTRLENEKLERELHPDDAVGIDPNLMHLTGPDFIAKLPPSEAAQVKALAEGRMAFPAGKAAASPYWQRRLAQVSQYDPEFDAVNFNARAGTRRDFTSGKSSQNIKALNTAIGHVGQLAEQISGTASHGGFPFATTVNAIENAGARGMGSSGITKFEQTAGAVAGELTQVFRGTGGAEADIQRYMSELNSNASEEQKKAAIANIAGLLKSRLDALNDQYHKGMGTTGDDLETLDPHAKKVLSAYLPGFTDLSGGNAPVTDAPPPPALGPDAPTDPRQLGLTPGNVPQADQLQQGATKRVTDPTRAAMVAEYRRRLAAGQSGDVLAGWLNSVGVTDDKTIMQAKRQAEYHSRFPNVPIESYSIGAFKEVPLSAVDRWINYATQSAPAAFVASAGNTFSGNNFDSIADTTGGSGERVRLGMDVMGKEHPVATAAGQVGALTAMSLGGEAGLGRMGMTGGLGRSAIANGVAGMYTGTGATDYDSEGKPAGLFDRVTGGAKSAAEMALGGLATHGVVRAFQATGGPVVRAGVRAAGGDADVAVNQVGKALREDGVSPRQAAAKITDARSRGVPMALSDMGENSRELYASVGRSRGESRSVVRTVSRNRQEQQLERISSAVSRDLGPTANIRDMGDELMLRAKDESAPLYQDAFSAPGAGAVSEKLGPLLRRPSIKRAMVRARRIAEEEGRDPTSLGFDLDGSGEVVLNRTPSWETLHYIKTGLDDVIEGYRDTTTGKLVLDAEGRLINSTKNGLLKVIDGANSSYKAARAAYAGPAAMRDALELGTGALKRAPDDVAANIKELGPSEMAMYQLGLRKGIIDLLGSKGDMADKVRVLIGTPKSRTILKRVLGGNQNYERFVRTLEDESQLGATYQAVHGNSATAGRVAFDDTTTGEKIAANIVDVARAGGSGGLWGAATKAGEKVFEAGKLGPGAVGDKARADIARVMSETDPNELAKIGKGISRSQAKARVAGRVSRAHAGRSGTVGAAILGALGQGTSPDQ